jgi:hypothetical protein
MKKGPGTKIFIYFLSFSFLLLANGLPTGVAQIKERSLPIGEMVSKGEVKYEARENVWKSVESSYFPVFSKTKMKTDKGIATLTLSNNSRIEVSQNSLFSFDQNDRFLLVQGSVKFRIPASSEMHFKVGNISIVKSLVFQATKGLPVSSPKDEETIGVIYTHPNHSVTVKSYQGKLYILNKDQAVLAALSSQELIMVTQAGEIIERKSAPAGAPATAGEISGAAAGATAAAGGAVELFPWWLLGYGTIITAGVGTYFYVVHCP